MEVIYNLVTASSIGITRMYDRMKQGLQPRRDVPKGSCLWSIHTILCLCLLETQRNSFADNSAQMRRAGTFSKFSSKSPFWFYLALMYLTLFLKI